MGLDAFFNRGGNTDDRDRDRLISEIEELQRQVRSLKEAEENRKNADAEIFNLASFPEQYPNPIIEISSAFEVRYLNPAAKKEFPDLLRKGRKHPALRDLDRIIARFQSTGEQSVQRELEIGDLLYKESIYYLPGNQAMRIFIKDITEQRRLEIAFKESEKRLRMITDNMMDVVSVTDIAARYQYISPSAERVLGYKPEEMIGKPALFYMHPLDAPRVAAVIQEHLSKGLPGRIVLRFRHKDGHYVWLEAAGDLLYDDNGKLSGAILSSRDISDRKAAEEQLNSSLKEKEVLLKEIHHRVKNNLQIISSLLNLQSAYIKDDRDRHIFKDCQNRVRSMALVHEKLYRSESLSKIDFAEYIRSLSGTLYNSYGATQDQVRFDLDVKDIFLDVDAAIHCGLLVNEIISNSFKHAFPGGRKGRVWVEMKVDGNDIDMVIGDDGVGLPEDMDIYKTGTLGIQLVTSLAAQIGGDLELDRSEGTVYRIRLRELK
ncbi:sensor histidine kinase [Methanocella sp. MCL-LM]|uniref:sensor histidine kinase n=1 Tax=Methanocella sp. MCL-LM TaxID=3412035 RepID=UPI003C77B8FA